MLWTFQPPEPVPVATDFGETAQAIPFHFRIDVQLHADPQFGYLLWPGAAGTHILTRTLELEQDLAEINYALWLSDTVTPGEDVVVAGWRWCLGFNNTHPGPAATPRIPPLSWSLWMGPVFASPNQSYPVYYDSRFSAYQQTPLGVQNFQPLHPQTFRSKTAPSGGNLALFGEFPAEITVAPYWP